MASIDIVCAECNADLDGELKNDKYGRPVFSVEPCKDCLEAAKDEGYQDGKESAE